jgi:hypothetical protein
MPLPDAERELPFLPPLTSWGTLRYAPTATYSLRRPEETAGCFFSPHFPHRGGGLLAARYSPPFTHLLLWGSAPKILRLGLRNLFEGSGCAGFSKPCGSSSPPSGSPSPPSGNSSPPSGSPSSGKRQRTSGTGHRAETGGAGHTWEGEVPRYRVPHEDPPLPSSLKKPAMPARLLPPPHFPAKTPPYPGKTLATGGGATRPGVIGSR